MTKKYISFIKRAYVFKFGALKSSNLLHCADSMYLDFFFVLRRNFIEIEKIQSLERDTKPNQLSTRIRKVPN